MLPKFCFFVLVLQTLEASKDVQDAPLGSLRFVQLLHRHGDRNPTKAFGPLDPNPESVWAQGWGQLTTLGMRQLHRLGQIIKKRYRAFISENYVHDEIYVRSTGVDRALMSAQCNLAGMFPPKGAQIWDQTIPWQPIPIHSKPVFLDWVMRSSKVCKAKLDSLIDHFLKTSPKVKRLIRDNLDLIRNVSIDAGLYTKGDDIRNKEAKDFLQFLDEFSAEDYF